MEKRYKDFLSEEKQNDPHKGGIRVIKLYLMVYTIYIILVFALKRVLIFDIVSETTQDVGRRGPIN